MSRMNLSAYFQKIFDVEKDTAAVQTFHSGKQAENLFWHGNEKYFSHGFLYLSRNVTYKH